MQSDLDLGFPLDASINQLVLARLIVLKIISDYFTYSL